MNLVNVGEINCKLLDVDWNSENLEDDIWELVQDTPTVDPVHAAGGCYCRECKYAMPRKDTGEDSYECPLHGVTVFCNGGHFCSYGEQKEE